MAETILATGNEAIGYGAIYAGCRYYFGYPITPQNEVPEFLSAELPKVGGVFVQAECEGAAINMLYGASAAGARALVSTSSPGIALMGEGISAMSGGQLPGVVVDVMRMGPGWGTIQNGQTDYRMVTKGGGHGGYHCLVLAPYSVQETFDLMQLAFHLSDKYRMVVIVLSDYIIGEMAEPLELRTLDFEPLPPKDWAVMGKGKKGGKFSIQAPSGVGGAGGVPGYFQRQEEKYSQISAAEVRYEAYRTEDADFLLVAYGSSARVCRHAVKVGRQQGLKLGLFRPISCWPFPSDQLNQVAQPVKKVLVVEDANAQLFEDVDYCLRDRLPLHHLGVWARDVPGGEGVIHPERILQEVKSLL